MKTRYSHLTLADRRQIERWRLMKMSATELAELLIAVATKAVGAARLHVKCPKLRAQFPDQFKTAVLLPSAAAL